MLLTRSIDVVNQVHLAFNSIGLARSEVKQAVDFFGRAIVAKALTASQEAAALLAPPPPKNIKQTMYKFNEGFSNAVRTTKRVSDFFA
ncbi:hypothetical protein JCM5353_006748 [Sporobolomyces roseus]